MAEPTANELLADALTRHQIGVQRLGSATRKRVTALLNATEADLRAQILRLAPTSPTQLRRLARLEAAVSALRGKSIDAVLSTWRVDMTAISQSEPAFAAAAMTASSPVLLDLELPSPRLLKSLVNTRPFDGRTLKTWADRLKRADRDRIMSQIRIGLAQGETPTQLSRRVVGTARLRGLDGVTEITRRQAEAVTRTAANAFANAARGEFFKENADIISNEVWSATLDSRTCVECAGLDGQVFPVGKGQVPPAHVRCRCTRIAVLDGQVLGDRPLKTSTERGLLREFSKREGIAAPTKRVDLPRGTKGRFDTFSRRRVRELTGTTTGKTTYSEFLRRQSNEFQADVLGERKARLFREGKLRLDRFTDRKGDELTLSQLATRERAAFTSAGMDPGDFI